MFLSIGSKVEEPEKVEKYKCIVQMKMAKSSGPICLFISLQEVHGRKQLALKVVDNCH